MPAAPGKANPEIREAAEGCGLLRAAGGAKLLVARERSGRRERRALAASQPRGTGTLLFPEPPRSAALLCLRLPGGPELASGRAAKAAVTLQEGFGRNL